MQSQRDYTRLQQSFYVMPLPARHVGEAPGALVLDVGPGVRQQLNEARDGAALVDQLQGGVLVDSECFSEVDAGWKVHRGVWVEQNCLHLHHTAHALAS